MEQEQLQVYKGRCKLLTKGEASRRFYIRPRDFAQLTPYLKPNGNRIFYLQADVADISERVRAEQRHRYNNPKEYEAQRRQKYREQCRERADVARAQVGDYKEHVEQMKDFMVKIGTVKLPLEILQIIVEKYVDLYEPEGLRGVAVTLKGLAGIACTCPDFLVAAKHGFNYFASKLPAFPIEGDWDAFFSDATCKTIRVPELKQLLKMFRQKRGGTKAGTFVPCTLSLNSPELQVRALEFFNVSKPTHIPARIIHAVTTERSRYAPGAGKLRSLARKITEANEWLKNGPTFDDLSFTTARKMRMRLIEHFPDMNSLQKYHDERHAAYEDARAEWQKSFHKK